MLLNKCFMLFLNVWAIQNPRCHNMKWPRWWNETRKSQKNNQPSTAELRGAVTCQRRFWAWAGDIHRSFIQSPPTLCCLLGLIQVSKEQGLKTLTRWKPSVSHSGAAACRELGDMWTARPWPFKKLHVFATWCVNIKKRMMLLCKNTLKWAVVLQGACRMLITPHVFS